ncbi:hypothetical protein BWQ96_02216 [Gracilariopsis chorda]|uniref:Uncharacterized protein n=1 Tax=Gracilariopsis chorda TaxID=448386 RepID=A0A2V3J128_9FLOR|nr:hypothetical protein BWQ96_02216 [Gracilariopsis chorda]|eukprot:PXF48025.1 hypothetical protein BWQ96_02216 [Gracilariopsis chorda]
MDNSKSTRYTSLPKLNPANYFAWLFDIKNNDQNLEPTAHLSSSLAIPVDPVEHNTCMQKKTRLTTAILSSVPPDILRQIFIPGGSPLLHEFFTLIISLINQSTKEGPQFLQTEAESIQLQHNNKIGDYIKDHKQVHQRILAAKYPNMKDKATRVNFLIKELKRNRTLPTIVSNS